MTRRIAIVGAVLIALAAAVRAAAPVFFRKRPAVAAPGPTIDAPQAVPSSAAPVTSYDQAKATIETSVARRPREWELRIRAAQFYMNSGDHRSAIPHLEAAGRLRPNEFVNWLALGDAASLAGRFDVAKAAYQRATALKPTHPLAFRGRGQLLVMQKKFTQARATLEEGIKHNPKDLELRMSLGNVYLVMNKSRLAVETLEPAVDAAPNHATLRYLMGEAYERDLSLNKATDSMRKATELEPSDPRAWGRLGLYLVKLNRFAEARPALEKAIELDKGEAHYYWALADSYALDPAAEDQAGKALELYERSVALDPKNPVSLYSYALFLTRRPEGAEEDLRRAAELLKGVIAVKPGDMNANYKLADTYRRLNREDLAAAHEREFQEVFEKGRKQAKRLYSQKAFVDSPEVHLKLGEEALRAGNTTLAVREFKLALERDPGLIAARRGLQRATGTASGPGRSGRPR